MSSFIGHAVTGIAIAMAGAGGSHNGTPRNLPWLVLPAVCADFDYLLYWSLGIDLQPRLTHSLLYALFAATTIWGLERLAGPGRQPHARFPPLLLAACSHLVLDLLVGVHSLPVFWPFVSTEVASPIGLLPSAAHLSLTNYYLWRNLFIEMGVLLPVLTLGVVASRTGSWVTAVKKGSYLVLPWLGFLAWSMSLHR